MERSGATQSLPSLHGNSFNSRFGGTSNSFGQGTRQRLLTGTLPKQSAHLSSSSSTPALPRITDNSLRHDGPKGTLWRESAAVLQAHAGKLPFLNQSPSPHSDGRLIGTQELIDLQRDAKLTRDMNASALRVAYETRGSYPRGLGGTLRAGGTLRPGDVSRQAAADATGMAGSFGSGAGGKRQKRQAKLSQHVRTVHRKENQQAALANDRQFVQQNLAQTVESPNMRHAREQVLNEHWWEALFAPIPEPMQYLPVAFQGNLREASLRSTGQRWHTSTPSGVQSSHHILNLEECTEIVRICTLFQVLTEKPDSTPPVLSRPAFCRMVCAMGGLAYSPGARTRVCRAVGHFDRLAEKVHVKGCSYPGGTMVGLTLGTSWSATSSIQIQDLTICKLFSKLLSEMVPTGHSSDGEMGWQLAKIRLFEDLFPQAERYAQQRSAFVNRQIQGGGPTSQQMTQVPGAKRNDDASADSKRSNAGDASAVDSPVNLEPRGNVAAIMNDGAVSDTEADEDGERGALLLAHTFAVLKGELLMSQLLEPEVLHVLLEFKELFHVLFRSYVDIPVAGADGHMTLPAFLRFCDDFGLFPTKVDFQTAQWLYSTAESCLEAPSDNITSAATGEASAEHTEPREVVGKGGKGRRGKGRHRLRDSVPFVTPGELQPILWSGKWLKGHLAWLTKDLGDMTQIELRCARLLEPLNEWMTYRRLTSRELFAMQQRENMTAVGLEALQVAVDFMHLEDPPSKDELAELLSLLAPGPIQEVDLTTMDMALMVSQKRKENLQRATNSFLKDFRDMTQAEYSACLFFKELLFLIERNKWTPEILFRKMDTDGNGALDAQEMEKQTKAFLKMQQPLPVSTMSAVSIESPFDILDLNGDGKITFLEFVQIFDQVELARRAQEKRSQEAQHPVFLSSNTARPANADSAAARPRRNFGHKAFVECLLKVGLVHLSYHGTAAQAEQSCMFKVLWLLMYLHWQFECAAQKKAKADAAKAAGEEPVKEGVEGLPVRGPKHLTPLERLLKDHRGLFADMQAKPAAKRPLSRSNGFDKSAWGGVADDLLMECLANGELPQAYGPQSFDALLLDMVTS